MHGRPPEPAAVLAIAITNTRVMFDYSTYRKPVPFLLRVRRLDPVDVVLADIIMPGMSGTELVRQIAVLWPQTQSVLMTAVLIDAASVPQGVPVLKKPFSKRDLICAVEAALVRSARSEINEVE